MDQLGRAWESKNAKLRSSVDTTDLLSQAAAEQALHTVARIVSATAFDLKAADSCGIANCTLKPVSNYHQYDGAQLSSLMIVRHKTCVEE